MSIYIRGWKLPFKQSATLLGVVWRAIAGVVVWLAIWFVLMEE